MANITSNSKWSPDSPRQEWEGAEPTYQFEIPGVTTITDDATLATKLYLGSADKSANLTGSTLVSGNVVTSKKITNFKGGNTYVLEIWGTADGIYDMLVALEIQVMRPGGRS